MNGAARPCRSLQTSGSVPLDRDSGALLCTHRPVLSKVFDALGLERVRLDPAGLLVVHHRKGAIVAVERHRA